MNKHRQAIQSGTVTRSNVIGLRKLFNASYRAESLAQAALLALQWEIER